MRKDSEWDFPGLGAEADHMDFFAPDCRPESSLYTSSVLQLFFGPEQKEFTVFSTLLDQYPKIQSLENAFYGAQIHLPDVDADVGHTMVHYFFTRRYQTLSLQDVSDHEKNAIEYGRALMTYYASRTYDLHDLAMLAQNRIEELSSEVKISSALDRIKAVFESGLSDDYWLKAHLDQKLYAVLRLPESSFDSEELTSRIGSTPAFDKAIVDILSRMTRESLRPQTNHAEDPPSELHGEEVLLDDEEPSSVEKDELKEPEMWDEPGEDKMIEDYAPPAEAEEPRKEEEEEVVVVADPPMVDYPEEDVAPVDDLVDDYPAEAPPEPVSVPEYSAEDLPEPVPVREDPAQEVPVESDNTVAAPADTDSYLKPDAYKPCEEPAPAPEPSSKDWCEPSPPPATDPAVESDPEPEWGAAAPMEDAPPPPPPPPPAEVVDHYPPPPPPPPVESPSEEVHEDPPAPEDYPSPPEEVPKEESVTAKPEKDDDLWALPTKKSKNEKKSPVRWSQWASKG